MAIIHLAKRTKLWINFVGLGVWVSGTAWVVLHFLLKPEDSAGLPNHAAQIIWLKVHGAFSFLALWTGGLLWGLHVVKAWRKGRHRLSGGTLFSSLLVLIVTGYLLYYVANDRAREVISLIHWILGLMLPAAYLMHRLAKKSRPSSR
jgi:hypothetical protein